MLILQRTVPIQTEIRSPIDCRLDFIIEFGQMAVSQGNRIKQLPKHNATTIALYFAMELVVYVDIF